MRIGIIGLGSIGQRHMRNLLEMGEEDLFAFDPRIGQEGFSCAPIQGTNSIDLLWAWQPEALLICSPPETHYELAIKCLENGANIFIEKPMASSAVEAADICGCAQRYGKSVAVGYMLRQHARLHRIRRWIIEGQIVPRRAKITCFWYAKPKTYPQSDLLLETSHELDLALWLFGQVNSVDRNDGHESGRYITLTHINGMQSYLHLRNDMMKPERTISIDAQDRIEISVDYTADEVMDQAYKLEVKEFLMGDPYCTGTDGLAVLDLIERLR